MNDAPDSLSIYGRIELVRDIIWISKTLDNLDGITWTFDELSLIVDKLVKWWQKDRLLITKYGKTDEDAVWISGASELRMRFKSIIDLIVKIIPVEKTISQEIKVFEKLTSLITEMELDNVPVLRAKASFVNAFYDNPSDLLVDIELAMKQKDEFKLVDAFDAILFFASYYKEDGQLSTSVNEALKLLEVPLRWDIIPQNDIQQLYFPRL